MAGENAFSAAIGLLVGGDPTLAQIVLLSLRVSLAAVVAAAVIGLPLGAALAIWRFRGRSLFIVLLNALMGLPPVVAGLLIFLTLSRSGPLGRLGLLFTPEAMMIAQTVLILPIVASLTRGVVEVAWREYRDILELHGVGTGRIVLILLRETRTGLLTVLLAGLGRALSEVGAILIVGGNIAGYTRTMTTAIALETSKGDLPLALGLGAILFTLTLTINGAVWLAGNPVRLTRRIGESP